MSSRGGRRISKYCVYSGRDCEILPSAEEEIFDEAYQQGRAGVVDDVKQFLYNHKDVRYTELICFLDNLEEIEENKEIWMKEE